MKNKAYDLASYAFSGSETFLFDANVWLYLYPPPSRYRSKFQAGI